MQLFSHPVQTLQAYYWLNALLTVYNQSQRLVNSFESEWVGFEVWPNEDESGKKGSPTPTENVSRLTSVAESSRESTRVAGSPRELPAKRECEFAILVLFGRGLRILQSEETPTINQTTSQPHATIEGNVHPSS